MTNKADSANDPCAEAWDERDVYWSKWADARAEADRTKAALERAELALLQVQPAIDTACGWALNLVPDYFRWAAQNGGGAQE